MHLTIIGTMHYDRKGIPKKLKTINGPDEKVYFVCVSWRQEHDVNIVDWQKEIGKKNFIAVTTMHDNVRVSRYKRQRP